MHKQFKAIYCLALRLREPASSSWICPYINLAIKNRKIWYREGIIANKKSQIIQSCFWNLLQILLKSNGTNIDNFLTLGVIVLFKQFNKTLLLGSK